MIASLRDTILSVGLTSAVIETSGAGMSIQAASTTLSDFRIGGETLVHTEMVVHEDSLTLFGFADTDERDSFRTLMSAKGVRARLMLAILTVHTPNVLKQAVASRDATALTRVPGLGLKGAQRVVLDMADKLGPVTGGDLGVAQTVAQGAQGVEAMSSGSPEPHVDVVATLMQLGWNEANTQQVVSSTATDAADGDQEPDVVAVLRASLRRLGDGHRG